MPVFEFVFLKQNTTGTFDGTLEADGPIIPVEVSMPPALQEWFVKNGIEIPPPASGYALIDTGASITAIHEAILTSLSIVPIDSIPLATPSGSSRTFIYPTQVSFPALGVSGYSRSRVAGSQLGCPPSTARRSLCS